MKKLRKNSVCALYKPRCTSPRVPIKTSTRDSTRRTTVSRSDVKNLMSRSRSIGIPRRLDKFCKGILFAVHDFFVTHQFVKPRLVAHRHDGGNEPGGLAVGIGAGQVHQ